MRSILIILTLITVNVAFIQGQSQANLRLEYINKYKNLAIYHQKEYKIPASIKLAQGILETAAGTSRLAREANNHFGIKCKEEWRGARVYHTDDAPNECFRAYKSAEDSYLDHSLFLSQRIYYVSLFKLDLLDYKGWANGLQKCGYATDPNYGRKLIQIIEQYDLHAYDKMTAIERRPVYDDIYNVKPNQPRFPDRIVLKRRIYETNGIFYITAQPDDTYAIIADDARMRLKRLLKFNEVTKERQLMTGDIVFLQNKKKQASREHLIHIVRAGESMYSISQIYGMKLKSVYQFNKLKGDYVPKPGDILKVRKKMK